MRQRARRATWMCDRCRNVRYQFKQHDLRTSSPRSYRRPISTVLCFFSYADRCVPVFINNTSMYVNASDRVRHQRLDDNRKLARNFPTVKDATKRLRRIVKLLPPMTTKRAISLTFVVTCCVYPPGRGSPPPGHFDFTVSRKAARNSRARNVGWMDRARKRTRARRRNRDERRDRDWAAKEPRARSAARAFVRREGRRSRVRARLQAASLGETDARRPTSRQLHVASSSIANLSSLWP